MKKYYILSLKHSPIGNDAVWWRPGNAGYTSSLTDAGIYTEQDIQGQPNYYNNEHTKPILCGDAEGLAHLAVDMNKAKALVTGKGWLK